MQNLIKDLGNARVIDYGDIKLGKMGVVCHPTMLLQYVGNKSDYEVTRIVIDLFSKYGIISERIPKRRRVQ